MIEVRTTVAMLPNRFDRWRAQDGREVVVVDCWAGRVRWRFAGLAATEVADLTDFVRAHSFIRRAKGTA